ncbi:hypothetical protein CRM22_003833 [Opisthorchis felineus]|uniref:RING-type E3 ubiquitin transferase n=1 Tax=Opisthorchis felineus TaxID=147828 RepID=A0A4S2LZA6_OPIFE|nr:hypothetical protein CRM22_003833 [Opisthorchis felineus]
MNEAEYIPISDSDSDSSLSDDNDFKHSRKEVDNDYEQNKTTDTTIGEDSENCPICFEPWTSTGPHKLCCLRCGHLFGHSCVLRWIRSQGKQGRCPQCNSRAFVKDIRYIYTRNLRVLDTSERDRALADLAIERAARRKAEQDAAEHKAKYQLLQVELNQLRDEFHSVRAISQILGRNPVATKPMTQASNLEQTQTSAYRGQYELMKSILLSNTGNCRVMASCDYLNALCVSQPSSNPIFRGFGIRKINTIDQRPLKYIHLHGQPIRDVSFHPDAQDGILISASLDKTLRLTSLLTDQVVQTYQCPSPVWSCCWASPNPHRLFAGCSNGTVQVFDVRVTSGPLTALSIPDNFSPVIGLQYVPQNDHHALCPGGGLLVGQLSKITFMSEEPDTTISPNVPIVEAATEAVDSRSNISVTEGRVSPDLFRTNSNPPITPVLQSTPTYSSYGLPLEGSLVSLSLVPDSRHFLASYRPSHRLPRVRHVLAELLREETPSSSEIPGDRFSYTCREVHNLWAGDRMKMLTRARLFKTSSADNTLLAVAGCENAGGVLVWRCDTGMRIQTIQPPDTTAENPLIDICPYSTTSPAVGFSDRPMLALLSERTLHLYRFTTADS